MRKSKFSESQVLNLLKQAESGVPVVDICRENGISNATFYKWRAKYGVTKYAAKISLVGIAGIASRLGVGST